MHMRSRVPQGALERLEPDTGKLVRPVLRGLGSSNAPWLPDQITVAMLGEDDLYVPLRTLTEYLGLAWSPQRRRVERDEVLARKVRMLVIHGTDGRPREMTCLPLETIAGWFFGLTA